MKTEHAEVEYDEIEHIEADKDGLSIT